MSCLSTHHALPAVVTVCGRLDTWHFRPYGARRSNMGHNHGRTPRVHIKPSRRSGYAAAAITAAMAGAYLAMPATPARAVPPPAASAAPEVTPAWHEGYCPSATFCG